MYAKLLNQAIYKTSLVLKHVVAKQILVKKLLCDLSLKKESASLYMVLERDV